MKRCPECRKDYRDDNLLYCLDDGAALVQGTVTDEPVTAILSGDRESRESVTRALSGEGTKTSSKPLTVSLPAFFSRQTMPWFVVGGLALVASVFAYGYLNGSSIGGGKALRLSFEPPRNLQFNDTQPDW